MLREADQGLRMESELDFFDDDEGSNRRFLQKVKKLDEDVLARSHIETGICRARGPASANGVTGGRNHLGAL
jgi:hypothetical protein